MKSKLIRLFLPLLMFFTAFVSNSNSLQKEVKAEEIELGVNVGDLVTDARLLDYNYSYFIRYKDNYLTVSESFNVGKTSNKEEAALFTFERNSNTYKYLVHEERYMVLDTFFSSISFKETKDASCLFDFSNYYKGILLRSSLDENYETKIRYLKYVDGTFRSTKVQDEGHEIGFEVAKKPMTIDKTNLIMNVGTVDYIEVTINDDINPIEWLIKDGKTASELTIEGDNTRCTINSGSIIGEAIIEAHYKGNVESCKIQVRDVEQETLIFSLDFKFLIGCDPEGIQPIPLERWNRIKDEEYSPLIDGVKQLLATTSANSEGNPIEQCVFIHDLCVLKYNFEVMFEGRTVNQSVLNINSTTNDSLNILIFTLLLGSLSIASLVYLKKKFKSK